MQPDAQIPLLTEIKFVTYVYIKLQEFFRFFRLAIVQVNFIVIYIN